MPMKIITPLPNGNIRIPVQQIGPEGQNLEGLIEIGPDDPRYAAWQPFIKSPRRRPVSRRQPQPYTAHATE